MARQPARGPALEEPPGARPGDTAVAPARVMLQGDQVRPTLLSGATGHSRPSWCWQLPAALSCQAITLELEVQACCRRGQRRGGAPGAWELGAVGHSPARVEPCWDFPPSQGHPSLAPACWRRGGTGDRVRVGTQRWVRGRLWKACGTACRDCGEGAALRFGSQMHLLSLLSLS